MNGVVGGLVAITAGCDVMLPLGAAVTGLVGGTLCTLATRQMKRYKIDDAVGVVPAHLVCGVWGTLAVALFSEPTLWAPEYSFWQKIWGAKFGDCSHRAVCLSHQLCVAAPGEPLLSPAGYPPSRNKWG